MKYHFETVERVLSLTQSTPLGLTQTEADRRLERNGKNKLNEAKSKSFLRRFAQQLADPMIIILIAAAVISAATTLYEGHLAGKTSFPTDTVIILAVVLINSVLGVLQESKAEKAIDALKEMSAACAKVLRDGKTVTVKSEDLVKLTGVFFISFALCPQVFAVCRAFGHNLTQTATVIYIM